MNSYRMQSRGIILCGASDSTHPSRLPTELIVSSKQISAFDWKMIFCTGTERARRVCLKRSSCLFNHCHFKALTINEIQKEERHAIYSSKIDESIFGEKIEMASKALKNMSICSIRDFHCTKLYFEHSIDMVFVFCKDQTYCEESYFIIHSCTLQYTL